MVFPQIPGSAKLGRQRGQPFLIRWGRLSFSGTKLLYHQLPHFLSPSHEPTPGYIDSISNFSLRGRYIGHLLLFTPSGVPYPQFGHSTGICDMIFSASSSADNVLLLMTTGGAATGTVGSGFDENNVSPKKLSLMLLTTGANDRGGQLDPA